MKIHVSDYTHTHILTLLMSLVSLQTSKVEDGEDVTFQNSCISEL